MSGIMTRIVEAPQAHVAGRPANVDETGWREGAKRCWLWVAVTADVTVFLVRPSRGRVNPMITLPCPPGPCHSFVTDTVRQNPFTSGTPRHCHMALYLAFYAENATVAEAHLNGFSIQPCSPTRKIRFRINQFSGAFNRNLRCARFVRFQ